MLMLAQASARLAKLLPRLPAPSLPRWLDAPLGGLLADPQGWRGVCLGVLLYAALAAAAASGSALAGGLSLLAFVAGTMPALSDVALLSGFFARAFGPGWRALGGLLFLLNAVVLAGLAVNLLR